MRPGAWAVGDSPLEETPGSSLPVETPVLGQTGPPPDGVGGTSLTFRLLWGSRSRLRHFPRGWESLWALSFLPPCLSLTLASPGLVSPPASPWSEA